MSNCTGNQRREEGSCGQELIMLDIRLEAINLTGIKSDYGKKYDWNGVESR
jgi:hypothetical protein